MDRPISFPGWKTSLAQASIPAALKAAYTREILSFLRHCKQGRLAATVAVAKAYLAWRERQSPGPAREALRWFYLEGARPRAASEAEMPAGGPAEGSHGLVASGERASRPMEPPAAGSDLGVVPWERDLIKAVRERNFLWRTEQTYREWALRFARFIAPRSPYAASGEDVAAFLSALAVQGRASPSSQKQALNALVFLMQEALHRDLGEMEFKRANPKQRLPTVLSVPEARSLFAQMEGQPRLMAELAYGAGLRLMELLRLRVHHLDFDRGRAIWLTRRHEGDREDCFAPSCEMVWGRPAYPEDSPYL
jgi:hypothetical protein